MKGFRYKIDGRNEGDRMRGGGISYGYGDSFPRIVALGKRYVVCRTPSTREWSGRGMDPFYVSARWFLWEIEWVSDDIFRVCSVVKERVPGRRWRAAKDELLDLFKYREKEWDGISSGA